MDNSPNNIFKIVDADDFTGSPVSGYYTDEAQAQRSFADAAAQGETVILYGGHHPDQLGEDADPWEILDFN